MSETWSETWSETLIQSASQNLVDVLRDVFLHDDNSTTLIIYDLDSPLSQILTKAYRIALPMGTFINFHETDTEEVMRHIEALEASDFVALVQSTSFRLSAFRIRIELFKKSIKVAEHPHLGRMTKDIEVSHYVNALAYDKAYYHHMGHTLKNMINEAHGAVIHSGNKKLIYRGGFETAKINIGDYREMNNVGGQFPIGEVFTESKELTSLNGKTNIIAFGDTNYKVNIPSHPITIVIKGGQIVATENSTTEFEAVLNMIKEEENVVWVRELGLGLNRAFSKDRYVSDMGTFERMCGLHLSLGAKHGIYAKEGMKRNSGKFHIDVMIDTDTFDIDDTMVFNGENWVL
jgi:leucyl aminopeptidase (aminopeptidase T)